MASLYKDPLTGLNNLFGLIEADISHICGNKGVLLYIDIKRLELVNKNYGKKIGDIYISSLGDIILSEISSFGRAYRVAGDEFIIIFSDESSVEVKKIAEKINLRINETMLQYNLYDAGIKYAVLPYHEKINSTADLLIQCNFLMERSVCRDEITNELPKWADGLINNMILRIKETLDLLQKANNLAMTDDISNLPNHRAAQQCLNQKVSISDETKSPFSVLFIDGDNLKKYNESGYEYGNQMIKNIANLIRGLIREKDEIFRWLSGDEFLVVLPDTKAKEAIITGERLRKAIEKESEKWHFPVTISIGVSNYPADGDSVRAIMEKAEKANSIAKNTGKNKTVYIG